MTRLQRWTLLVAVAGSAVCGRASPAAAWVLYETESGSRCTLRWYDGPTVSVDQSGVQGVAGAALRDIAKRALDQWQATVCAGPTGLPAALPIQFGFGGLAVPTPVGATCTDAAVPCKKMVSNGNFVRAVRSPEVWPYGATVFALTVVTFDQCTGEIVDADIQLDDGGHQFCAGACGPGQQDLSNTLTHEVGHLLGLDHSVASESTMDSSGPSGQTKKATLHGDDRQGVCAAYTGGCGRNHVCAKVSGKAGAAAPPEPGSCAARPVASHLPAVGWILAALAMGAGVIRLAGRTRWPTSRRNPKFAPGYGP